MLLFEKRQFCIILFIALICFDMRDEKLCEEFDGDSVLPAKKTKEKHFYAGFGLYRGRPTVVGGMYGKGTVETMTSNGKWKELEPHPR